MIFDYHPTHTTQLNKEYQLRQLIYFLPLALVIYIHTLITVNGTHQLNTDKDANFNKKKKIANTNSGTQSDVNFACLCGARSRLHGPSINDNSGCHKWFYKGV